MFNFIQKIKETIVTKKKFKNQSDWEKTKTVAKATGRGLGSVGRFMQDATNAVTARKDRNRARSAFRGLKNGPRS